MNYVNRINTTPFTPVPDDTTRTHGPVRLMLGATPGRRMSVGLLLQAPPPLGTIEVYLTGHQVTDLHHQLDELVHLSADETAALISRLHEGRDQS
ncbi:hypothetical protein MB901379_03887 [Mycobacterium basiliense]|uniref:Uncharacterized protein n=1 Tax=Mycobacterium basiliense TaxID=2094119 RepID=A0A3S5D010_9MYCO|nr:hypothetical protein [Mycobacterium basiliense]VDM90291.1 hypothetical protein MB901379_03887 [Mycobacterium basiliense]